LDLKGGFVEIFGGLLPKRFIGTGDDELYAFSKKRAVFNFGAYLEAVRVSTDEVLRELGRQGEIDLFELASALSFRTASRFMIGETIMSPGFFGRWRELFFATNPLEALGRFQWNLLNPLFWRRQDALFSQLEDLLARVIDAKHVVPGQEQSFLDAGLTSIYQRKSRGEAVGHVYMMFLAAYLNPTLTLGWTLCDLLEQEPYRRRVMDEVAAALGSDQTQPLQQKPLEELQMLQLCAMETLRLRIKAVNVRKVIDRPFVFRDYRIPVGALVCNSPTFAHLSEQNYERPQQYWPERWLGTAELEHSTMTARYMPFGTFAHICPGKRFSYLWLKMSVVELLRRFELERIGPSPGVREGIMPVLGNRDGPCMVRYRRR
jgi:sterol 14alpha-demethylase